MIYLDGHSTAEFVKAIKVFQASLIPVLPGRAGNSLPACDVLAVKFDFYRHLEVLIIVLYSIVNW